MKIINFILFLIHLAVAAGLYLVFLNQWISAEKTAVPEFASLFFPVLVMIYLLLIIYWIFGWKKRSILFILLFIPLFSASLRWINFSTKNLGEGNSFKIITYNTHNGYGESRAVLENFLQNSDADFVFLQEAGVSAKEKPQLSKFKNNLLNYRNIAIYCNGEILQEQKIEMPVKGNGNAQFADIEVNGENFRLINIYLEPFYIVKSMVKPTENLDENKGKSRVLEKTMQEAFKTHTKQVEAIIPYIKNSPYPVIICGDFNSVPNSYEYFHLKDNLTDGFTEAGNGSGTSFHDFKFPLRIDYIFGSKNVKFVDYKVHREVKLSDHFPVFATVKVK